ncbi:bifunctional nuclease family protein [Candidatus Woesearchaeota archaeon]|nr:bifunctional nuclease family protein [Candidatus Woesearchaeota archaeon]
MAKRFRYNRLIITLLVLFLIGLVVTNILIITNKINFDIPELSTEGFVRANIDTVPQKVILSNDCYSVVGTVSDDQVHSIENALLRIKDVRPLSHDTTVNILKSYKIEVLMVKVTELKENNFIGKLFLKSGNKITSLDVRPSDGIAIALRSNAPIYMNETLLKEQGVNTC